MRLHQLEKSEHLISFILMKVKIVDYFLKQVFISYTTTVLGPG